MTGFFCKRLENIAKEKRGENANYQSGCFRRKCRDTVVSNSGVVFELSLCENSFCNTSVFTEYTSIFVKLCIKER